MITTMPEDIVMAAIWTACCVYSLLLVRKLRGRG